MLRGVERLRLVLVLTRLADLGRLVQPVLLTLQNQVQGLVALELVVGLRLASIRASFSYLR